MDDVRLGAEVWVHIDGEVCRGWVSGTAVHFGRGGGLVTSTVDVALQACGVVTVRPVALHATRGAAHEAAALWRDRRAQHHRQAAADMEAMGAQHRQEAARA